MSVNIATNENELLDFLNQTKEKSNFNLEQIKMSNQKSWHFGKGAISHISNGFFQVVGIENQNDSSDQHLILYQPQSALTGLILHQSNNEIFVLLQARVEPGNTGIIQYGPTIQCTPANYLRLHGGKATSYIEYFISSQLGCSLITHSMQQDLGFKYYQKSKSHHYLLSKNWLPTDQNMIWASLNTISRLIQTDNFFNADLRSLLSVFDWTLFFSKKNQINISTQGIDIKLSYTPNQFKIIDLNHLKNWRFDDDGITPLNSEKTGIKFFNFNCTNREVTFWSQPLFTIKESGTVNLYFFENEEELRFLVSAFHEPGTSTSFAYYPSLNMQTDKIESTISIPKKVKSIRSMTQCDEGGRFFQNEVHYHLIEVYSEQDIDKKENQSWISVEQLVGILKASNSCSFELRCISSLALDKIHPNIFLEVI